MPAPETGGFAAQLPDILKLLCSVGSLAVTAYFWFVRINRERVALGIYPVMMFEGRLEPGGIGAWTGKLFLANRSIIATAVVEIEAELWWKGKWRTGACHCADGSELPWNLPPAQAFAKTVTAAFDVGADTPLEKVYAERRLRLTFVNVDGTRVEHELRTAGDVAAAV